MKRFTILLALTLTVAGSACTQNNNQPAAAKRVYRHGTYVQTGSNIPTAYREYGNSAGEMPAMKVQHQQFQNQNLQANAGTTPATHNKDIQHL